MLISLIMGFHLRLRSISHFSLIILDYYYYVRYFPIKPQCNKKTSYLRENEGDAGVLPLGIGVELPDVEELEQVAPQLHHGGLDLRVQVKHLEVYMYKGIICWRPNHLIFQVKGTK